MGRPHALARRVALGGQQPLGHEGFDQGAPLGAARLECGKVDGADHRRRRAGDWIGGDVAHQAGNEVRQLFACARVKPRERLVGGLGYRRAHAAIVGKAQQAVAARRLGRSEARQRHLQQRQGVAAARVSDEDGGE